MKERLRAWAWYGLPPALWLAAVLTFSSGAFSSVRTSRSVERLLGLCWPGLLARLDARDLYLMNYGVRKLAHLTEYALLAALLYRAYSGLCGRRPRVGMALALAVAAAGAVADETRQSFTMVRTATLKDVLLDVGGAVLGVAAYWCWERRHASAKHRRS